MKKPHNIKNAVMTIITIAAVLFATVLVGFRLYGASCFTVLSGSMEPVYHTGALIFVKHTDTSDLKEGDVITFMLNQDTIVTHRITEVVPDEKDPSVIRFRTKGDANDAEDGTLTLDKNVIGRPIFSIPYLGYVANYVQHPPGTYITIGAAVIIIALMFLTGDSPQPQNAEEISRESGNTKERRSEK